MNAPRTLDEALVLLGRYEAALVAIVSLRDGPALAGAAAEPRSAGIARDALKLPAFVMPTKEATGETI
ncbi:MAG: hypothetical protein M0Z99_33930 [Betaproteobacteria bacterium]|nr:hypothetical protein [Betaproteobacteria bacterium]